MITYTMKVIFLKSLILMGFFLLECNKNVKLDIIVNVKIVILSAKFVLKNA